MRITFDAGVLGWVSKRLCKDCRSAFEAAELVASESIVDSLERGARFLEAPWLRKGRKHLRIYRDPQKYRYPIGHPFAGFPVEFPNFMRGPASKGCHFRAYGDCETLEWVVFECLDKPEPANMHLHVPPYLYVPTRGGKIRPTLDSRHLRAMLGVSQSVLNDLISELPGLRKEVGAKGDVVVDTVEFLAGLASGRYPRLIPRHVICSTSDDVSSI